MTGGTDLPRGRRSDACPRSRPAMLFSVMRGQVRPVASVPAPLGISSSPCLSLACRRPRHLCLRETGEVLANCCHTCHSDRAHGAREAGGGKGGAPWRRMADCARMGAACHPSGRKGAAHADRPSPETHRPLLPAGVSLSGGRLAHGIRSPARRCYPSPVRVPSGNRCCAALRRASRSQPQHMDRPASELCCMTCARDSPLPAA